MRQLIVLRGPAGCGKSTWVKDNGLQQYTLSADDIRLLFQSPVLDINGKLNITMNNDRAVWALLFQLLEKRMERGEFTIIDATHSRANLISKYKDLASKYRYRVYVVDFTQEVDLEQTLAFNAARPEYKRVPEEAIRNMYARITTQAAPGFTKVISPAEYFQHFGTVQPLVFEQYKRIHHIGDIHGCAEPLLQYFERYGFNEDEFYIFVGDYIDRGPQNVYVLDFLQSLLQYKNVLLLEGNHEVHLWRWANDEEGHSKEFNLNTQRQLEAEGIEKKDIRQFYRRLGQLAYYRYFDKLVLVNHGGLPVLPNSYTATTELIKGPGRYEEIELVQDTFNQSYPEFVYQVHGHRNPALSPIRNGRCFNLCDRIEFGGHLRAVILDQEGWHEVSIKNDVFVLEPPPELPAAVANLSLLEQMRENPNVQEKKLYGNISSFNFTRRAFNTKAWDEITTKARGLFVNTKTERVVARSYEKFFNLGERSFTKLDALRSSMQFPARAYLKENGFLGIVGYDEETDELVIATKSTVFGPFQQWFKTILENACDTNELKDYIKDHNVSLIFEVVDPANDPHIIEYDRPALFLLDVVGRTWEYNRFPYTYVEGVASYFGFHVKTLACRFENWEEFYGWVKMLENNYDYRYEGQRVEGFVVEDAAGFMFKIKTTYYTAWKKLRAVKDRLAKGRDVNTSMLVHAEENQAYHYMRSLSRDELAAYSIIDIRNLFEMEGSV